MKLRGGGYQDVANFQCIYEVLEWAKVKNPEKDYNYLSSPLKEEREAWALRDGKQVNATDYSGLCLWGDEAPCFNTGGSLFIFLWSLLGVIDLTRHWICCFPKSLICKCGCKGRHTYDSVLKVIVWMMVCALSDDPPELRHDGIPFSQSPYKGDKARAARYASKRKISRCCILKKKGDWCHLKQVCGLQGWRATGALLRMCYCCYASWGGVNTALDASLGASWRNARFQSNAEYMATLRRDAGYVSELFNLPGFIFTMFILDLMHIADLGITQVILGNIIFELILEMGGTIGQPDDAIVNFMNFLRLACHALDMKPPLTGHPPLSTFKRQGKDPRFRGKAAQTRYLLNVVVWILENCLVPSNPHQQLRYDCLKFLWRFYRELENWDPAASPGRAEGYGRQHCILYIQLSREHQHLFERLGYHPFKYYPKHHLFVHCCEEGIALCGNPREVWAYRDESAIGDAVDVAESCHPCYSIRNVIDKRRL